MKAWQSGEYISCPKRKTTSWLQCWQLQALPCHILLFFRRNWELKFTNFKTFEVFNESTELTQINISEGEIQPSCCQPMTSTWGSVFFGRTWPRIINLSARCNHPQREGTMDNNSGQHFSDCLPYARNLLCLYFYMHCVI